MNEKPFISLITDGGEEEQGTAGSACILCHPMRTEAIRVSAMLGTASSIEAEIFAGLLGFAVLRNFETENGGEYRGLVWKTDNMTIVKGLESGLVRWAANDWRGSSGRPVKQAWLWRIFLLLSDAYIITGIHVQRDSGDSQQRACDKAARWAQKRGKQIIGKRGEGPVGRLATLEPERAWRMLDCSELFIKIKDVAVKTDDFEAAARLITEKVEKLDTY